MSWERIEVRLVDMYKKRAQTTSVWTKTLADLITREKEKQWKDLTVTLTNYRGGSTTLSFIWLTSFLAQVSLVS